MTKRWFALIFACFSLCGCGLSPALQTGATQDDLSEALRLATLGQTAQARQWADRAIAIDPHNAATYGPAHGLVSGSPFTVSDVFSTVGDDPSLVLYMQKANATFPNLDWPLVTLTQVQERLGDVAGRQKSALALVDLLNRQMKKPGAFPSAPVLTELAQAYFDAGETAKGAETYQHVIDTFPHDDNLAGACNDLAYAYAVSNTKLPDALVLVNRSLSLLKGQDPESTAAVRDTLGWVQYRMHDYKAALSTMQAVVNDAPRVAESRYHLAMTYKALGQTEAARVEFQHAVQLSVGYAAPQKELVALSGARTAQPAA